MSAIEVLGLFLELGGMAILVALTFAMYSVLNRERAKRIEALQLLVEARTEREEWRQTAQTNLEAWQHAVAKIVRQRADITDKMEQINSLMNGDRCCVEGHRYYTGHGISCPWCSAEEMRSSPVSMGGRRLTQREEAELIARCSVAAERLIIEDRAKSAI